MGHRQVDRAEARQGQARGRRVAAPFYDFDAWLYQGFDDSKAPLMEVVADTLLKVAESDEKLIAKIK